MFAGMILLAPGLVSGSSVPSSSLVQVNTVSYMIRCAFLLCDMSE